MECPITRIPIEKGDCFEFETRSGKRISYSAKAYLQWVERGKLVDPLTREDLSHRDLLRLQTVAGKSALITSFNKVWNIIANRGLRKEFEGSCQEFVKDVPNSFENKCALSSFLIVIKGVLGPAVYRSCVNRYSKLHEEIKDACKISQMIDHYAFCHHEFHDEAFSFSFHLRKPEETPECIAQLVKQLRKFEIITLTGSVARSILAGRPRR